MIEILEKPQKDTVSSRDRIFTLREVPGKNSPVIVVDYFGAILLGHNNDRNKKNFNLDWEERIWDYHFYAILSEELLIKIIECNNVERAVKESCNVIHRSIVDYLFNADINVIRNVLAFYKEASKPKRYFSLYIDVYEYRDEIWISPIESIEEIEREIRILYEQVDYFGPELNKGFSGTLFITDDEKISGMYRCAFSLDEFKETCGKLVSGETLEYFMRVWEGELDWAHKFWTYDTFNHFGTVAYGDYYPKWDFNIKLNV